MAQLVLTAGRAALGVARAALPALGQAAAGLAMNALRPAREGPRLAELPLQTSTDGAPMPRLWGRARMAGQVIWAARFAEHSETSGGGKGGPKQTGYTYSLSFAVGVCEGEIAGIGRIWANGALLDRSRHAVRWHAGREDQMPDPLISAIEGVDAPGFRGTAYLVFEDLALDAFGHRIPNLSVEVFRGVGEGGLERQVRGINLIPGCGEFALSPDPVMRLDGPGAETPLNRNNARGLTDVMAALEDLERDLPACRSVQIVLAWFGDDLRCGVCELRPGVEDDSTRTRPSDWSVAGIDRSGAWLIGRVDGRPVYGGTPDDAGVIALIGQLRARGYRVTLYPFILMDIPAGNGLADPDGGSGQPAYPWRGRIRPEAGSVAPQVSAFMGSAQASDFSVSGATITYAGPSEWRYRRFILHCAALARAAGGVDGFLIGSEMVALSTAGLEEGYPAVAALCDLAAEARTLLGPSTRLSYAADWSEYHGHQPADGAKHFHLDPLWSHPAIDAVAIDFYIPLADWRTGADHLDTSLADRAHDRDYLAGQVAGGEGYDWYYASPADRDAQVRTPIIDATHGEAWVWRVKDLVGWWSNPHHDRPDGVRVATPSGWVPMSKPVWITETGCPAVDKGANQPNVFIDPKSAESRPPHFSTGARDDLIQRRYLEALLAHWDDPAANPVSPLYGGPMVEPDWTAVWAFDARPWPDFPARSEVWSDGENWRRGHWLNGRAGLVPVGRIIDEMADAAGLEACDTSAVHDLVAGYLVDRPMPARDALAPLVGLLGLGVLEGAFSLRFVSADVVPAGIHVSECVDRGRDSVIRRYPAPMDLLRDVRLQFHDDQADYRAGHAAAREHFGTVESRGLSVPVTADAETARRWCSDALEASHRQADHLSLTVPPSLLAVEIGDVLTREDGAWQVIALEGDSVRTAELTRPAGRAATLSAGEAGREQALIAGPVRPALELLDIPLLSGELRDGPRVAAWSRPWPGAVDVWLAGENRLTLGRPARFGVLDEALGTGPVGYWDQANALVVTLDDGHPESHAPEAVLAAGNRIAVEREAGAWEVIAFCHAALQAPGRYRLTGLLRGLGAGYCEPAPLGSRVVLLDTACQALPLSPHERGVELALRAVEAGLDPLDNAATVRSAPPPRADLEPLPPAHLRLSRTATGVALAWIRQTRTGGDDWSAPDVPLGEAVEAWQVILVGDGVAAPALTPDSAALSLSDAALTGLFGALPGHLLARVAQISARIGPGREASAELNL
ncbi:glycoside hydrolase/phage tail family protein [uncultured Maricaulis sp.]|uniref:baseplate multidomain protein megatron n=1 Tax=uncultured Maricaulis sp. TaxID=174710 RepID=UPI0025FC963B|nr:glycoside hydrolase/phage tail family protein [uncultured Maricaulis sp.]